MPVAHLLTHVVNGSVHSAWHSEADARDFMEHYNLYREDDAHLAYREVKIGVEKKREQVPGWFVKIDRLNGRLIIDPRIHSFTSERRPKHIVSSVTSDYIDLVSFVSPEHAIECARNERRKHATG